MQKMQLFYFGTSVASFMLTLQETDMKKTVFIILVFLIGANSTAAFNNYGGGFRMFYTSLQPYGDVVSWAVDRFNP